MKLILTTEIEMTRLISKTFRSVKPHLCNNHPPPKPPTLSLSPLKASSSPSKASSSPSPLKASSSSSRRGRKSSSSWSVYLILSTNSPIKTYVGVTTNFSRRLKQHNGELKGGAKASRSGRPWICACIIRGFKDRSEACELESKWKSISKKLPRKRKSDETETQTDSSILLLRHREAALGKVKGSFDCSQIKIDWKLNTS